MAIQFPNFLAAQTAAPDYSGIGDSVENFYKGYNMPKDALIKEIQAKFAQPNAEAALKSTNLANTSQSILNQYLPAVQQLGLRTGNLNNRKTQIETEKQAIDLGQQRALQKQLAQALMNNGGTSGGSTSGSAGGGMIPQPMVMPQPQMQQAGAPGAPVLPGMPNGLPMPPRIGGMTLIGSPPVGMGAPSSDMQNSMPAGMPPQSAEAMAPNALINPVPPSASTAMPEATVITKGSPQLAGIDAMYDSNPLSREFLEKKGFKKTQEVKFDNKTGKTTVITKYPSGKVTVQASSGAPPSVEGIPLTNKMISKHQNIISSIDNALPAIQKLQDLGKNPKGIAASWEQYPRDSWRGLGMIPGFQSAATKYEAIVSSALDSLIGAYGLPSTNEGIETVKKQLLIGHGETDSAYKARLKELVKDLEKRKAYSSEQVKKSNKISPVDSSAGGASNQDQESYSSNDWEAV